MTFAVRNIGGVDAPVDAFVFTDNVTVSMNVYNLKTRAIAAGWDQVKPLGALVTIGAGVTIGSTSTSVYAWDTGVTFPAGTTLQLVNNGIILGAGGAGGKGGSPTAVAGGAGGPAIRAQAPLSVTNNNTIAGGGGGGGGGHGYMVFDGENDTGHGGNGGCGGRGIPGGAAGALGAGYVETETGSPGVAGVAGSATAGGSKTNCATGGNWGAAGARGLVAGPGSGATGALGGAAGAYATGNNNITWLVAGTRLGNVVA